MVREEPAGLRERNDSVLRAPVARKAGKRGSGRSGATESMRKLCGAITVLTLLLAAASASQAAAPPKRAIAKPGSVAGVRPGFTYGQIRRLFGRPSADMTHEGQLYYIWAQRGRRAWAQALMDVSGRLVLGFEYVGPFRTPKGDRSRGVVGRGTSLALFRRHWPRARVRKSGLFHQLAILPAGRRQWRTVFYFHKNRGLVGALLTLGGPLPTCLPSPCLGD